jgi:hypothetical protein
MHEDIIIELAPDLTAEDVEVLRRYLADSFRLSDQEWQRLRAAIERLSRSTVVFSGRRYLFGRFYDVFINGTYARPFLQQLRHLSDLPREGPALQADVARRIAAWLRVNGLVPSAVPGAEYLLIYCLYWWAAFARGYLFERVIIHDMTSAGIRFQAHAPERGWERYAPYDLSVPGLGNGDIKASLYFLDDLPDPLADFYVTRLYDAEQREVKQVVFLTLHAWRRIDGPFQSATITKAPRSFPSPVMVEMAGKSWIVVEYQVWKNHLLR